MNKVVCAGILFASMMLAACGSDSATDSSVNDEDFSSSSRKSSSQTEDVFTDADYLVSSYAELPSCIEKKAGQTGFVTGTSKRYVCEDGEWVVETHNPSTGILTDGRDGKKYKTIKIGEQVWMAENLNYAYLEPTAELDSSSFCYDNDPAMCKKYGRLYLWSAAMDSAGVLMNDGKGKGCGYGVKCGDAQFPVQGICPSGLAFAK